MELEKDVCETVVLVCVCFQPCLVSLSMAHSTSYVRCTSTSFSGQLSISAGDRLGVWKV